MSSLCIEIICGSEYTGDYNELVYLRARYYAPGMGRFLTRDTWTGDPTEPITLNGWIYVNGNPINLSDPSGNHPTGNHSAYCDPLSGPDRSDCEKIVRGISPASPVSINDLQIYDLLCSTDDCSCLLNNGLLRTLDRIDNLAQAPLDTQLPHSLYMGTWKEYGWWWHYLLDRTPGWWNNQGGDHIKFSDVISFALAAELSTAVDTYPDIIGYAAGAFANKGGKEGFYSMIGSRQSVFMRVNNAVYGTAHPDAGTLYNFGKFGSKFGEVNLIASNAYRLRNWGANILSRTGFTEKQRLAYEWGNPTNLTPQKLISALHQGNMGEGNKNVLYFTNPWSNSIGYDNSGGLRIYHLAFVLSQGQMNELCGNASCVNP